MQVCIWGRWNKRNIRHKIHYSGSLCAEETGCDWGETWCTPKFLVISRFKLDRVHVVVHFYYFSLSIFFIIYNTFHSKNLIALNSLLSNFDLLRMPSLCLNWASIQNFKQKKKKSNNKLILSWQQSPLLWTLVEWRCGFSRRLKYLGHNSRDIAFYLTSTLAVSKAQKLQAT